MTLYLSYSYRASHMNPSTGLSQYEFNELLSSSMNSSNREMNRIRATLLQSFERENVFKKKKKKDTKCMYELWSYDIAEDMISARLFAITSYSFIANRSLSRSIRNERRVIGRSTDDTKRNEVITCEAAVPRMLHRFFFQLNRYMICIEFAKCSLSCTFPMSSTLVTVTITRYALVWVKSMLEQSRSKKKKVKGTSKEEEREDTSCEILIEGESKVRIHRMLCSIAWPWLHYITQYVAIPHTFLAFLLLFIPAAFRIFLWRKFLIS